MGNVNEAPETPNSVADPGLLPMGWCVSGPAYIPPRRPFRAAEIAEPLPPATELPDMEALRQLPGVRPR